MDSKNETVSDNELIAQFMGYEKVTVDYFGSSFETEWQAKHQDWMETVDLNSIGDYIVKVKDNEWVHWKDVAYDTSWDWLMPVVEKIANTGCIVQIQIDPGFKDVASCMIAKRTKMISFKGFNLLEVTYKAVVEIHSLV